MKNYFQIFFFICALYNPLYSQEWEPTYGPNRNMTFCLLEHKKLLYMGTEWGAYFSSSEGNNWQKLPLEGTVFVFKIYEDMLLAGSSLGLFYSVDGNSWAKHKDVKVGIRHIEVINNDIFAAASNYGYDFYHSSDGINWTDLSNEGTLYNINGMGKIGNTLYVSGEKRNREGWGLYSTKDKGITWESHHCPRNGYKLISYEKSIYLCSSMGISISSDECKTWNTYEEGIEQYTAIHDLCFVDNYIYAATSRGVYRASVLDYKWFKLGLDDYYLYYTFFIDDHIYVSSTVGDLFKTNKTKIQWELHRKFGVYAGANVHSLKSNGKKLLAKANYNSPVYFTEDYGYSWKIADWRIYRSINIYEKGDTIVTPDGEEKAIIYSHDGGQNFNKSNFSAPFTINTIEGFNDKIFLLSGGLFFSDDGGKIWKETGPKEYFQGLFITENWILAFTDHKIFRSNNGVDWRLSNFPEGSYYFSKIIRVKGNLIITTGKRFYKSEDAGLNWIEIDVKGFPEGCCLQGPISTGNIIYVHVYDYGDRGSIIDKSIYVSEDLGENWKECAKGLESLAISSLAAHDTIVFAGVSYNGIYKLNYSDSEDTLQIDGPLQVFRSNTRQSFKSLVFPNPAEDQIIIDFEEESFNGKINFYNMEGALLKSKNVNSLGGAVKVKVNNLPKGVYLVEFLSNGKSNFSKLIIK